MPARALTQLRRTQGGKRLPLQFVGGVTQQVLHLPIGLVDEPLTIGHHHHISQGVQEHSQLPLTGLELVLQGHTVAHILNHPDRGMAVIRQGPGQAFARNPAHKHLAILALDRPQTLHGLPL